MPIISNFVEKCPHSWIYFKSKCYKLLDGTYNWDEANSNCWKHGGHLASVQSSKENDFIYKLKGDAATWIGGKKHKTWKWNDGAKWSYTNWNPSEPSGDGNCIEIYRGWNGKWNDKPCHYKIHAICKRSPHLA